jgi:hypothetical protein
VSRREKYGRWPAGSDDPAQTEITGAYSFWQVNLGVFRGIGGILASDGKFQGMIKHLEVEGSTYMPDFGVTSIAHKVRLGSQFHAVVNATNGDVELRDETANFGNTIILFVLRASPSKGQGSARADGEALTDPSRHPESEPGKILMICFSASCHTFS